MMHQYIALKELKGPAFFKFSYGLEHLGTCIVIALYGTVRFTALPLVLYVCFPCVGLTELFTIFWYALQIISIVRETEAIIEILSKNQLENFGMLTEEQRAYQKKVLRATRPIAYDAGDLMDFTLSAPVEMWEEILNQLLFLLTL